MKAPEQPINEAQRLAALAETGLLDTPPEARFDRITRLAAQLFDVPTALISLVDENRQWFKSCVGLDARQTGRDVSFCGHAILNPQTLIIEDALADDRFDDNPLVIEAPYIRFYAGAPVEDRNGHRLGTLCLIDYQPRTFSDEDQATLRDLADMVERELQIDGLGVDYGERARALSVLNDITLDTEGTLAARIERALATACEFLGMQTAIVSRITGDAYTIEWHHEQASDELSDGMTLPLEKTYCSLMLPEGETLAIDYMGRSRFREAPCYQLMGLESYIAAPIWFKDSIAGTLNFSSSKPRHPGFTEIDIMFVNLLARRVADALQQEKQAETLKKLVTNAPGMLYQFRLWPNGRCTFPYASPAVQRVYRVSAEEVARDASRVFDRVHPDDLPRVRDSIASSARDLSLWHEQYRVQVDDSNWTWVEGQSNPERLPDGSVLWHGYIMDIDERHKTEQMKNDFISTVSHELRTPLTSIAGSLELVIGGATGPLPEKTEKMLSIAQRNTNQLRLLINDLLDIEKLVSGKMPMHCETQSVSSTVRAAIQELHAYASPRHIRFRLHDHAPEARASFDALRLKQALSNLLSNAVKFSPDNGMVDITLQLRAGDVIIEVRDQGPGIPDSFRDRVFQKFAQAENASTRSKEGTGLGLAITRELMAAMGGDVGFESTEGQGALFWVSLPATSVAETS